MWSVVSVLVRKAIHIAVVTSVRSASTISHAVSCDCHVPGSQPDKCHANVCECDDHGQCPCKVLLLANPLLASILLSVHLSVRLSVTLSVVVLSVGVGIKSCTTVFPEWYFVFTCMDVTFCHISVGCIVRLQRHSKKRTAKICASGIAVWSVVPWHGYCRHHIYGSSVLRLYRTSYTVPWVRSAFLATATRLVISLCTLLSNY